MANIRNETKTSEDLDVEFKSSIEVDPDTKCWNWTGKIFRFRHGDILFNPRHYALMMDGYTLEPGRNYKAGCCNEQCVNPEHTRLIHDGSKPDRGLTLYLSLGHHTDKYGPHTGNDFQFPNSWIAKKYHVSRRAASKARDDTLDLIEKVKESKLSMERLANMYHVAPSYIKKIRDMTLADFRELEETSAEADKQQPASEFESTGSLFKRRRNL